MQYNKIFATCIAENKTNSVFLYTSLGELILHEDYQGQV